MTIFFLEEVHDAASRTARPTPLKATTLDAAKREATRARVFKGTTLVVSDDYGRRAVKSGSGAWADVTEYPTPDGAILHNA